MGKLAEKNALITGGAGGIGRVFAARYVQEGARVALADLDYERAQKVARTLGDAAIAVPLDVTERDSIAHCVEEVERRLGPIHILINNAAVFDLAPTVEITEESYHKLFACNVYGTLFMLQAVAQKMIDRGQGGRIINMASQSGRRGEPLVGVYCATKAAVISLTQSTGLDLIQHGINVNGIAPGVVDGELWNSIDSLFAHYEQRPPGEKKKLVGRAVPYGRMGKAEDLAGMAVFLASEDAEYIVAQTYNVDGGNWMS